MVLGIAVDLSALLTCSVRFLVLTERESPVGGPSRLLPRQSEKSYKQGFGASPVGEVGRFWKRALFLFGEAFRSEIGSPFWPII